MSQFPDGQCPPEAAVVTNNIEISHFTSNRGGECNRVSRAASRTGIDTAVG